MTKGCRYIQLSVIFLILGTNSILSLSEFECQNCHSLATDGRINVHLVPHSHDDVGWRKTVVEYYHGDDILRDGVKHILKSTLAALKKNPRRRFIQVETAFFWKWWQNQSRRTRRDVRTLVAQGRLEIINGAWTMNDEATTNYQSIIDQFTWGFLILNRTLGRCARPRVGWQIDPFGHSREHAAILKRMGFEGLVLGRIDYRDKERRTKQKDMEFVWRTDDLRDESKILTTVLPNFYVYESGYCFDSICSDRISGQPRNRNQQVDAFAKILDVYRGYTRTPNILIPMGSDFAYREAKINFENTDRLIQGFKHHPVYNMFYSTPSCYIKAVGEAVQKVDVLLSEKSDDFFPYASNAHSFWTGFYTSRPTLKRAERIGNSILQCAKQLATFSGITGNVLDESIVPLCEAMGVLQHHDAITGTEKQHVADDYVRMLDEAIREAERGVNLIVGNLLGRKEDDDVDLGLSTCLLANISVCGQSKADKFLVVVYNPLSRVLTHYVRLPVDEVDYKVTGSDGEVPYDVLDGISEFGFVREEVPPSRRELVFAAADLPPLGMKVYYVERVAEKRNAYRPFREVEVDGSHFGTETNGFTINTTTGKLISVTLNRMTMELEQEFLYYLGAKGMKKRASGAYIFSPVNATTKPLSTAVTVRHARGLLVDEVIQYLSPTLTQIIRVYKRKEDAYLQFDWLIGDLQDDQGYGVEVITKFKFKDFSNKGVFYTDSNGRVQVKRRVSEGRKGLVEDPAEEPVAGNYYPVTSKIVIRDEEREIEAAILTDRAQGGSSLEDGTVELMIHRRLVRDDSLGVDEVLAEDQYNKGLYVRGQHVLVFGSLKSDESTVVAIERDLTHRKLFMPWILVGNATFGRYNSLDLVKELLNFEFTGLKYSLPVNIKILTLEPWTNSYLLRLEHIMEKDEDAILSQPVTIDLKDIFSLFHITDLVETNLDGNVFEEGKNILWEKADKNSSGEYLFNISIEPMEIKTFLIKTDKNNFRRIEYYDVNKANRHSSSVLVFIFVYYGILQRLKSIIFLYF